MVCILNIEHLVTFVLWLKFGFGTGFAKSQNISFIFLQKVTVGTWQVLDWGPSRMQCCGQSGYNGDVAEVW